MNKVAKKYTIDIDTGGTFTDGTVSDGKTSCHSAIL